MKKSRFFLHPLIGSNPSTLSQALNAHPPATQRQRLRHIWLRIAVAARAPLYRKQLQRYHNTLEAMPVPDNPIFIIGHWRSGTTHLHNLFCQDAQFGSVSLRQTAFPWNFLGKNRLLKFIMKQSLPKKRPFDEVALSIESPQEEEMALGNMGPLCYYYTYYFPQSLHKHFRRAVLLEGVSDKELEAFAQRYRYLFKKLTLANGGLPLLLKNPSNTARMAWLRQVFPKARFIHIHRNPFDVFASTVKHFEETLPLWALQNYDGMDWERVTLDNYRLLHERFFQDLETLPQKAYCEVSFEDIEKNPLDEIEKIYQRFNLPGWDTVREAMAAYLQTLGSYRKNTYKLSSKQVNAIEHEWGFTLKRWGYSL